MNGNSILISILEDSRKRYHWVVGDLSAAALQWQPDRQANSISVTIWHVSRVLDVFLVQKLEAKTADNELWFKNGWAERTNYDPRGLGLNKWGTLTGYSSAEVQQVPRLNKEHLLQYFDETVNAFSNFIEILPADNLGEPALSEDGAYSNFDWLKLALLNMTRHIGEILALKAMYERHHD